MREHIKTGEQYGLMMTKRQPAAGKGQRRHLEMKKDGTMQQIHEKWFGVKALPDSAVITEAPLPEAPSERNLLK